MAGSKLYYLATELHVREELAQSHYIIVEWLAVEPVTCQLPVQCPNPEMDNLFSDSHSHGEQLCRQLSLKSLQQVMQNRCLRKNLQICHLSQLTIKSLSLSTFWRRLKTFLFQQSYLDLAI